MTTLTHPPIDIPSESPVEKPPADPGTLSHAFGRLFALKEAGATEVYLIRHGQPDYEAAQDTANPWDPPLSNDGREQAMRLATRLQRAGIEAVYSSTMARAHETAAFVASLQGLTAERVADLREIAFDPTFALGTANGARPSAEHLAQRFLQRPTWDALRGFEPAKPFRHRVIQAIEAIIARHPGQRVVVVAHGGVINAYLSMILDIPRDMFFLPIHTSLTVLRSREDLYALDRINDVAHLPPALQTY